MRRFSVALVCLSAVSLVASAQDALTPRERHRLDEGELVRRPRTTRAGRFRYIGGTSWLRVRAPRREVWRVIDDVTRYPRLLPGVVEAREIERRPGRRLVYLRHRYAFVQTSYYAVVRPDPERYTIDFELDRTRPHDVRAGRGFLMVTRWAGGRESIVTWGIRADVGAGLLTGVFAPLLRDWILRVPECVRAELEPGRASC